MTTKDIIFVHGWGEDSRIWEGITRYFPDYNHHFIDLGFIDQDNDSGVNCSVPACNHALFVTHSLGTLWMLRHVPLQKIGTLVAINGFGRFTDFAGEETLKIMTKSLHRNIILQMEMFWKNCFFPQNMQQMYKSVLNEKVLSQGLSWLGSWDEYNKLQDLKVLDVPVLSLGGEKDKILPPEIMKAHWENLGIKLVIHKQAGHALPLTHPRWCVEQIKRFLSKNTVIDMGELS